MDNHTTVIYYTSNTENNKFAQKVMDRLLESMGNLPLISVSQKPLDFGYNVNMGDIGVSEQNVFKQMLTGCEIASTPFVTFVEADTLYPPEYFQYVPEDINKRYWFENVYILHVVSPAMMDNYYLKGRSDCAHMAGREHVTKLLREAISEGRGMKYKGSHRPTKVQLKTPIINVKTGDGMRPKTQVELTPFPLLPYWGTARSLRKELMDEL